MLLEQGRDSLHARGQRVESLGERGVVAGEDAEEAVTAKERLGALKARPTGAENKGGQGGR